MSSRKQLLVLSTTAPLLMFGAAIGVAAPKDFSICTHLQGTGAGYGLCRAGVAVGCPDGTGNAQACANIEDHFLTVTDDIVPWLACPCNFDGVLKQTPPWGGDPSGEIICRDVDGGSADLWHREINDFDPFGDGETLLQAGELAGIGGFCSVTVNGVPEQPYTLLGSDRKDDCLLKLLVYRDGLQQSQVVGAFTDLCPPTPD